jgi:hypothetical protein
MRAGSVRWLTAFFTVATILACSGPQGGEAPSGPLSEDDAVASALAIVTEHGSEDLGLCDFEHGWGYAALRALDGADDPGAAARAADRDRRLTALTSTDLFRRWHQSRTVPVTTDEEIRSLLRQNPTWYDASGSTTRRLVLRGTGTYEIRRLGALGNAQSSGRWVVKDGQLWLEGEDGALGYPVERGPYSFLIKAGELGTYEPEPMVGDC